MSTIITLKVSLGPICRDPGVRSAANEPNREKIMLG